MNFNQILEQAEKNIISKLEISGYDVSYIEEDKQRTDHWFEQRKGKFTGSEIYKLMKTTRATSKMIWGREEKRIDFSETAIKYVFGKAMERKRNKVIRMPSSRQMIYGTENEAIAKDLFLKKNSHYKFIKVGFIEFLPKIAGSSADGKIIDTITNEEFAFENKCAVGWDAVYDRSCEIDEKHQDFWQFQAEMLSLKVKKLIYTVAEPSSDIFNPNITDISFEITKASIIHQTELIHRCHIGNLAINLFLRKSKPNKKNMLSSIEQAINIYTK